MRWVIGAVLLSTLCSCVTYPLHKAAWEGDLSLVTQLLEEGERIESRNRAGMVPLHVAVIAGNPSMVELLIDCGAAVDQVTPLGWTALHLAAMGDHGGVAKLLLERGAEADVRSVTEYTPLCVAESGELAVLLLDHGASVDFVADSNTGDSPLHLASFWGRQSVVETLVARGANRERVNAQEETPLDLAVIGSNPQIAEYLRSVGATSNLSPEHLQARKEQTLEATKQAGKKGRLVY